MYNVNRVLRTARIISTCSKNSNLSVIFLVCRKITENRIDLMIKGVVVAILTCSTRAIELAVIFWNDFQVVFWYEIQSKAVVNDLAILLV